MQHSKVNDTVIEMVTQKVIPAEIDGDHKPLLMVDGGYEILQ